MKENLVVRHHHAVDSEDRQEYRDFWAWAMMSARQASHGFSPFRMQRLRRIYVEKEPFSAWKAVLCVKAIFWGRIGRIRSGSRHSTPDFDNRSDGGSWQVTGGHSAYTCWSVKLLDAQIGKRSPTRCCSACRAMLTQGHPKELPYVSRSNMKSWILNPSPRSQGPAKDPGSRPTRWAHANAPCSESFGRPS